MLSRVLEPEVMDTVSEAVDYNSMDHSHVNRVFVDDLIRELKTVAPAGNGQLHLFDAGTGTALIPLELVSRPEFQRGLWRVTITASDLAEQMLVIARHNVAAAGYSDQISLVRTDCKSLPDRDETYDVVMSNSIIHHIPQPREALMEMTRILKRGGFLFVRDLMRPTSTEQLDWLVNTYAEGANEHQRQMFRDSLHAALTVNEVSQLLRDIDFSPDAVQATSDRHWTIAACKR